MNINKIIHLKEFQITVATAYGIALFLIALLVFSVDSPNPAWGKNWFIRPLVLTPIIATIGGFLFYIINQYEIRNEIGKLARISISILVYIFFLWIGTVIGCDGTLWN